MTRHSSVTLEKRGAGSTFASSTEHTPVFNTVHIIAAVIGIIGALAGIITVIYLVRRKRSKKDSSIHKIKVDIEANMIQQQQERRRSSSNNHSSINNNSDRFGQFASDFDNTVAPPKPVTIHVEDVSPMMQQYQLQLKLLQQQQQERNTLHVPQHTRANSASSSTSSPTTLLPPPPYHP